MSRNKQKQAMGAGIKALLKGIDEDLKAQDLAYAPKGDEAAGLIPAVGTRIPIDKIVVNPKQPRQDFDEQALEELAASIKTHDIIQPITVVSLKDGTYMLVSGERRWRASKIAGLFDIPAYIRTANDQELLEMALLENLQRENLNAIEIALSYKRLMDECDLTQEGVADRMKKERSTVANYMRLLNLPPDIQKAVRDGHLSMGHARAMLSLKHIDEQLYVYREVKEKGLSVRQVEALVKNMLQPKAEKEKTTKDAKKLPPAYQRIEDDIASHFSMKVELDRKKSGKGTLKINFQDDNELERIMQILNI